MDILLSKYFPQGRLLNMKAKSFDCVQMKQEGQEYVQQLIRGKSKKQILEFWKKQTEQFRVQHKN